MIRLLRYAVVLLTVVAGILLSGRTDARQGDAMLRLNGVWPASLADLDNRRLSIADVRARLPEAEVWLLRVQAAWCGTCQWHAAWTPDLVARAGGRVAVIDVIVADEDNQPADADAGRRWRVRTRGAALTAIGAATSFDAVFRAPAPLPRVLVVDARTFTIVDTLANPGPNRVQEAVARVLDPDRPPTRPVELIDDLLTADQWALVEGMRLSFAPPDPTNHVADDPAAAAFGFLLFFDKMLSPAGVACSSCHNLERLFTDAQAVPNDGAGPGRRNMPTVLLSGHARSQLWDGRADSLWSQAVMPFEDRDEMASSRLFVAHGVGDRHPGAYEAVFGPLPDLSDRQRFPRGGGPGSAAWAAMRAEDQAAVTRVFANVGKAIAAFERSLRVASSALDRYAAGDRAALNASEKDGLVAFLDAGCAQCHFGPRLSNDAFHNLRFPTGRPDRLADWGRAEGLPVLLASEFSRHGPFSDAPTSVRPPVDGDHARGAFRTPSLRGIAATAPYGHGGTFPDLQSVIDAHRTGGLPVDSPLAVGHAEPWAQGFDAALTPRIVRFLDGIHANFR